MSLRVSPMTPNTIHNKNKAKNGCFSPIKKGTQNLYRHLKRFSETTKIGENTVLFVAPEFLMFAIFRQFPPRS